MEESESAALPQGVEGEEEGDIDFLEVLRSSWELASAIQFCRLFGGCLKLKPFSTEKLEAALLEPDDHSMFLAELLYKLLRRDTREPYTEREAFVWEDLLKRKLDAQWPQAFTAHPMPGGDFYTIDPLSRMNILYALCEWRLDECAAIREVIRQAADNPETADHLRHEPIGEDSKGNRYFHFADDSEDCRLYREEPPRKRLGKKNKDRSDEALWETVCTTLEDMSDFAARMSASRNKNDKALHDLLTTSLLPKLMDTVQARRKAEERAAALEAMPKKRSSRLQVLQIKKDEEERKKKEEEEERARVQREQERVRKDREREMRLKARQDEEERLQRQAAELRRKLAGIHPDGPSREERYYRRLQQIDNGEIPSRGSSESRDVSASEPSRSQPQSQLQQQPMQQQQQPMQEQQQEAPSEAVTEHNSPERKPTPPVPTPRFHQPLDFPMPPMGAMEAEPMSFHPQGRQPQSSAPWQQHHNPYRQQRDDFQQQQQHQQQQQYQQQVFADAGGRQLRQRGANPGQEVKGRKREHSPGWSPMGLHVIKRRRVLTTRPHRNMSALAKFGKPLPPPRMDDYYEGSDLDLSSESEGPVYKPRARADRSRRRQKESDSDPDYEGEKSERSGRSAKARAAAKRSTASNTVRPSGGMQHQGFQSQQMQAQRLQEQEMQRRQLMARYQNSTPAEQQLIKQQLLAQRQQQYLQQQQLQMAGMAAGQPGMAAYDAQAKQAALRQQMQAQQRQEVMRLLSTLTPEQREQLSRLPAPAQNQFLAQLRQRHMEQQQVAAQEAARQHELQQRMLATLNPQQVQQLQAMPKPQQQAALASLTQRFQAQEQARLMQRQQAMQQMQQGNGSMAQPMLHQQQQQSQHGFAPQSFQPRSQEHMPGTSGGMYSPRAMSGAQQQQQRSQFIPTQPMIPTGPSTLERGFQPQNSAGVTPDWARHSSPHPAMQKASAGFAPQSASMAGMLEPLPVSFPRQSGSLSQQQSVSGPLTSMSQPSLRPPYFEQPRTSSPFVPQEMQGGSRPQSGQHAPGEEAAAGRAELPGSSRYSAPVTTGHDKGPDGADRGGAAPSQVTSGAAQGSQPFQQVPSGLQRVPAPTPVQPASRPMSSGPSPLLIITSAAPSTTVGVAAPHARDTGFSPASASDPEAKREAQELFQQDEAEFPDSEEQEGRCPSPLPVSMDELGEADDLQDIDLPWESERTSSLQQSRQPAGAAMDTGVSEQQKEAKPSVTEMPSNAEAGPIGQSSLEPRDPAPGSAQAEESLDGEGLPSS
ncbi:g6774 [Coccomyxa elongata]